MVLKGTVASDAGLGDLSADLVPRKEDELSQQVMEVKKGIQGDRERKDLGADYSTPPAEYKSLKRGTSYSLNSSVTFIPPSEGSKTE